MSTVTARARAAGRASKPDPQREPADRWARERAFFMTVRPLLQRTDPHDPAHRAGT